MHSLPIFVLLDGRPVILIGGGEAAAAKRRLLERAGAIVVGEAQEARIAIVAIDPDGGEAVEPVVARLRARGILVNATDRPDLCDFTLPAIVDRAPVLIAVGTGGRSAGLAKALRQRLETLLPPSLGRLADAMAAARGAIRTRWPDAVRRRRAIDAAFDRGAMLDPLRPDAADQVDGWLATDGDAPVERLVTIRLRSIDPDRLTVGEARLLGQADRIYHRPDAPAAILDRARADAVRIACAAPPADPGAGLSIDLEGP